MSGFSEKSPEHCRTKGQRIKNLYQKVFFVFSAFFITILALMLLILVILRPQKPQFSLKQVDIYQLNLSSGPNLINFSIQLTLFSKNPNQKVGVYYDQLQVHAVYKGQQMTFDTSLPPFYQGHEDDNLLTASLVGTGLPVAPSLRYEVGRDQAAGKLVLSLRGNGRLRWKVGTWVSGRYRFNVNCVAVLAFGPTLPTASLSSKKATQCTTTI